MPPCRYSWWWCWVTEDLRTGNFYNKARKDRDELSFSGLDTNWDDLSEFGIDDNWEKNLDSSSKANDGITTDILEGTAKNAIMVEYAEVANETWKY